jgi:hypothetical protein
MVSFLPVPGGFFTIANRCLSPALVKPKKSRLTDRDLLVDGLTGFRKL